MRRNAASASGGFRRYSRIALASVCDVVFVAALAVGCGSVSQAQSIPFTDHGSTQQSAYDGPARIAVVTDPAAAGPRGGAPRDGGPPCIPPLPRARRARGD